MSERLGIVVNGDALQAVLLRRDSAVWSAEMPLRCGEPLGDVLGRLLAGRPRRRWPSPFVGVMIGEPRVQVRRLEGLPPLSVPQLTQLVRANATALFLNRSGGLAVGEVYRDEDGAWGAAFDRHAVEEILMTLRLSGLAVAAVAPARGFESDARRAAALLTAESPLVWTPPSAGRRRGMLHRARHAVGVSTLILAAALCAVAPTIRSVVDERRAAPELILLRSSELEALRTIAEVRRTTNDIGEIASFAAKRGRITRLLAALSRAAPESTAVVSFRADSLDGSLTLLAPRITAVLPALSALPEVERLRIIGSISREAVAGARLERASVGFRRRRERGAR